MPLWHVAGKWERELANDVGRMTVPDQERVAELLRATADRKGVRAGAGVLMQAYSIAYETSSERDYAALDRVVRNRTEVDSRLVAEAMLLDWESWSYPAV